MLIYDGQPPVSVHLPVTWGGEGGGGGLMEVQLVLIVHVLSHTHTVLSLP